MQQESRRARTERYGIVNRLMIMLHTRIENEEDHLTITGGWKVETPARLINIPNPKKSHPTPEMLR
jgi:hypothetical protein